MIYFGFSLNNPVWTNRFKTFWSRVWSVTKNKTLEIEVYRSHTLVGFSFTFAPFGRDHGGFSFDIELFGYALDFHFHDNRHWDPDTNTWQTQDTIGE